MNSLDKYLARNREAFLEELQDICRVPSITGRGEALERAARLVADHLDSVGAKTRIFEFPDGPPIVYGEVGDGPSTLLVYNHYDVQPPEPLELWRSEPFSATISGGLLYSRGASDNKGNLMARIHAIRAYMECVGPLPLTIKFIVEGEEESNSKHLGDFVEEQKELLRADGCLWEGSWKDPRDRHIVSCRVKGICYVELRVKGAAHDLHSSHASIVSNPAWRLVWALSTLLDEEYRIKVKGVSEEIGPLSRAEEDILQRVTFDEEGFKRMHGLREFIRGISGGELVREYLCAPTCTICGLRAGYTGEGVKTVLPSEAVAKLDFRLVPEMTPERLLSHLRRHFEERDFKDLEIRFLGGVMPAGSDVEDEIVRAAVEAIRRVCREEPIVYPLAPWSGPLHDICKTLGIPSVAFGISHAGSLDHAPNENIRLSDYFEGIRCMMEFMRLYSCSYS